MNFTYVDTAFTGTTAATALDAQAGADDDRVLYGIIVGKPTAAGVITVYTNNNAYNGATTNIAFKYTYPTFGAGTPASDQFRFGEGGSSDPRRNGIVLSGGGSVTTSAAMEVTFLWDNPDQ